jgi:hypothetical protein
MTEFDMRKKRTEKGKRSRLGTNLFSTAGKKVFLAPLCLSFALCSLFFAHYLGACALPIGVENVNGVRAPFGSARTIVGEDLAYYFHEPVTGMMPVTEFEAPGYTGTVVWMAGDVPLDGVFVAGTVYTATVTLSAKSGYSFKGVPAAPPATPATGSFFHSRSVVVNHPAGTDSALPITVFFGKTGSGSGQPGDLEVTYYNLQLYVPVPVPEQAPVMKLKQPDLTLSVKWLGKDDDPLPDFDTFEQGVQYKAVITLTAVVPWKFGSGYPFAYYPETSVVSQDDSTYMSETDRRVYVVYKPTGSPTEVPALDLTHHIPAPVTGAAPVWSVLGGGNQYTGIVQWEVSDGAGWTDMPSSVFQPGMTYRAVVALNPWPTYVFAEDAVVSHDGRDQAEPFEPEIEPGIINVTISFPATSLKPVTDMDLTPYVPAPFKGGTPVTYFSAPQYTGTVGWIVFDGSGNGSPHSGLFEANTEYEAIVTLSAALGYIFTDEWNPSYSNGSLAAPSQANHSADETVVEDNGGNVTDSYTTEVDIIFDKTGSAPAVMVTDLDLTPYLAAPVWSGVPTTYFFASQYTGAVKWTVTSSPGAGPHSGLFGGNKVYTATVTLTAASGYTFDGVEADAFTHDGAPGASTNEADSGVVTITFPATDTPVTDLDLTPYLAAPAVGKTPETVISASAPQYTGEVEWTSSGGAAVVGQFETDMSYTATVTLEAKPGYTFAAGTTFVYYGKTITPTNNTGGSTTVVSLDGLKVSVIHNPW